MRIDSDLAFLAGCISSDGCVYAVTKGNSPSVRVELCATVEPDWADFVVSVAARAGIAAYATPPGANKCIHVICRSSIQAWLQLAPASAYIMQRKWLVLDAFMVPRIEQMQKHAEAYAEVMRLVNDGMVRSRACAIVKEQFGIKGNTVQFWVYNGQKPRLLNLPEVV